MPRCKVNGGFVYVTNYSYRFRELIQSIAEKAEKSLPSKRLKGIGIFLFGSPSRQEMIDESDADVMILRDKDSEDYNLFRSEFMALLEKEKFSKIDVPDWGTFEECEAYIKHSITEGNQIVESKFVYGDPSVNEYINNLRDQYCTIDRFEKVFCFQKLYFDQYYRQRSRQGIKNVKYGHGGTRDFMFITWFINILDSLDHRKINIEDNFPMVHKSLSSLYERRLINFQDYMKYLESINVVLVLRNDILIQNRWTTEEGLTYLDDRTLEILFRRDIFKNESIQDVPSLKKYLERNLENVFELKIRVWHLFLDHLSSYKGTEWANNFRNFLDGKINQEEINKIQDEDELSQMVIIWNIDYNKNPELFSQIFQKYKESKSWPVLASICCHAACPPEVLDYIAINIGCSKGYEYLLRIISRNKQVPKETLKKIIDNPNLEYRYKIVAKTAYEIGVEKANELR
ncbi:MAG: hypothetical protein Q8Q31_05060 [Nanoarchaeota archaeon]|nr:hypothetical protein [Nanoarchaeota archaeon]